MPLPSSPSSSFSPSTVSKPAWFRLARWFGAAQSRPASARARGPVVAEENIELLRTQARRRLIGAVVLLAVGVVAFPLVFETEPRPLGADTPMQRVQGTVGGAVATLPAAPQGAAGAGTVTPAQAAAAPSEAPPLAEAPPPAAEVTPAAPPPQPAAPTPTPAVAVAVAERDQAQQGVEAQRARALLEGRSAAPATTPAEPVAAARYVVQVGAFSDKRALADVRGRVERLGLKTYTQVIDSPAGPRTRVRVGPFDSRAEADAAGAKLRTAGLPAAILTL